MSRQSQTFGRSKPQISVFRRLDASALKTALSDPIQVLGRLGLLDGARQQPGGYMIRCPWHNDSNPSCSVRLGADRTLAVHCFACGTGGDVLSLIAKAHSLDDHREFGRVLELADEIAGGVARCYRPPVGRWMPTPRLPPPVESVGALWAVARPVTDDADLVRQLHGRCLDPAIIEERDLARCLPRTGVLPAWTRCRSQTWWESGHRLILPMWNAEGALCSVHARLIESPTGDTAKGLFPAGHSTKGLFLADSFALLIIRTGIPYWWCKSDPPSIIITEGAPDFLTVATHYGYVEDAPAVLGVVSGSWSDALAARIPSGCRVAVKVHSDEAGRKYRDVICRSLRGRCRLMIDASVPSDG